MKYILSILLLSYFSGVLHPEFTERFIWLEQVKLYNQERINKNGVKEFDWIAIESNKEID